MVNLTRLSDATDRLAQTLAPESAGQVPGSNTEVRSADPAVVDSDALTAETDIELPDTPAPTGVDGELGRLEYQATRDEETFAQETERRAQQAQTQAETSVGEYLNTLVNQQTESELQQEAQTAAVVSGRSYDEIRGELNSINNRIQGEQHSLRRKIERIQDNPEGLSRAGIEARVNQEKRKSARYQADLAIQKTAIQGDFTLAKDIADRAVDAQLEQQQLELDAKKFILDKNWDLFTTAEQRAFQTQLSAEERKLDNERYDSRLLQSTKLEVMKMAQSNGASSEELKAIQEAQTPGEVIDAGGMKGSVDMLDREYKRLRNAIAAKEYDKLVVELSGEGDGEILTPELREDIAKMPESKAAQTYMTLNSNMTRLKDLYETYGSWNPINREAAKNIAAIRSQLEIDIAVAGEQGAISDQEADRYQKIVGGGFFERGKSTAKAIEEVINSNDRKIENNIKFVEAAYPGAGLFEPFAQFREQKEAESYIEEKLSGGQPTTDADALNSYVDSFSTQTSTQKI